MSSMNSLLTLVAQQHLDIDTLETRHDDHLDIHCVAVERLRNALEVAFKIGIEVVNAAGVTFRDISQLTEEVSTQVAGISIAIGEIAKGSEHIVTSVRDIENVSKESAGQSQNVSAAAQELTASMTEISSSSQNLAKMAQELQQAVDKFRM